MPPHATQSEQAWDESPVVSVGLLKEKQSVEPQYRRNDRSISFHENVNYRKITPLAELSEEEISCVWYDDDEYARIKEEVTATIQKHANGDDIDEEEGFCMRGLEGRTKFGAKRRKNNKAAALQAVWSTQVSIWKGLIDNPAAIAVAYKPHAQNSKYPAIQTGYNDEQYVKHNVRSD